METDVSRSRSRAKGLQFAATRWSMVVAAGNWRAGTAERRAMGELSQIYWFPLYAYLRRRGSAAAEAEDLVQGFLLRLLEKDALLAADRGKGKFRSFILASLKNFVTNEWDKSQSLKRGGGETISLDAMDAEARYAAEPVDDFTPERVFERRWALALLEQVFKRLRQGYTQRGHEELFQALKHVLIGSASASYAQIAGRLDMTEGAVKVASHRLRRRFRELLREECGQTVAEPGLVDEEIRQLVASL